MTAKTDAQRQKATRARRKARKLKELRSVYVEEKDEQAAKELVRKTFPVESKE